MTNSVIKRHFYGFSGGKNVGFYQYFIFDIAKLFFFCICFKYCKKRCCLQYSYHCVAFAQPTTPKIYVKCLIISPVFSDLKILITS